MRKKILASLVLLGILAVGVFVYRQYLISEMRKPVLMQLKDPDSALFRNEKLLTPWNSSEFWCGEVNAKNEMGGYSGYQKVYVIGGHVGVNSNPERVDEMCNVLMESDAAWWWLR